jgi:hypothetical protein
MKIPLASINISEEVNKTGIWKQVNEGSCAYKDDKKKKSPNKNRYQVLEPTFLYALLMSQLYVHICNAPCILPDLIL